MNKKQLIAAWVITIVIYEYEPTVNIEKKEGLWVF